MGFFLFVLFFLILLGGIALSLISRDKDGDFALKFSFKGIPVVLLSFLPLLIALSYTTVDAGNIGIVKWFGQPTRQLDPGIHLIVPIANTVTNVTVQTRIVKPSEDASSRDLQMVHTEVTLAYHVDPRYATDVLVNLNDDAETRVITPAILEAIKAITAQYDVQDLVGKRAEVRDKIETFVKERLLP